MNNKYQWTNNIADEWIRKLKIENVYKNNYLSIEMAKEHLRRYISNYNENINSSFL
jgi:hypothetical protein